MRKNRFLKRPVANYNATAPARNDRGMPSYSPNAESDRARPRRRHSSAAAPYQRSIPIGALRVGVAGRFRLPRCLNTREDRGSGLTVELGSETAGQIVQHVAALQTARGRHAQETLDEPTGPPTRSPATGLPPQHGVPQGEGERATSDAAKGW